MLQSVVTKIQTKRFVNVHARIRNHMCPRISTLMRTIVFLLCYDDMKQI